MINLLRRAVVLVFLFSVIVFAVEYRALNREGGGAAPVITMEETSISLSISCTDEDILAGITAWDEEDGDVTAGLIVESLSNFVEVGRRIATITAFDSDNNVTTVSREIVYSDYESPRFSLSEPLRFVYTGTASIESTLTVTDCLDGDLSEAVAIETDDTVYGEGSYTFTYEVTNSVGDMVSLTATVDLYDSTQDRYCPHAVLSEYLIYVERGSTVDPLDYLTGVYYVDTTYSLDGAEETGEDGELMSYTVDDIRIDDPVDTSTPGTYEITYTMLNSTLSYQTDIRLIVIVE